MSHLTEFGNDCYLWTHSNQCICFGIKLFLQRNDYHLNLLVGLFSNETRDLWEEAKDSSQLILANLACAAIRVTRKELSYVSCRTQYSGQDINRVT